MGANGISRVREILCHYCDLQLVDRRRYRCQTALLKPARRALPQLVQQPRLFLRWRAGSEAPLPASVAGAVHQLGKSGPRCGRPRERRMSKVVEAVGETRSFEGG